MLREVEPDDPLREDVELLSAESDRCRAILARLSVDPAGDVSDAYTLVPLPALIEAAAQSYKRDGIAIVFESGPLGEGTPQTAPIQVRSPEIMQGIGNIVQNAVSFARHEIFIATRWTAEWSEVEVSDDGPGFSKPCSTNWARPSFPPARARRDTWDWVFSSPRRYWNALAPPSSSAIARLAAARLSPCAGQIPSSRLHSGRCRR